MSPMFYQLCTSGFCIRRSYFTGKDVGETIVCIDDILINQLIAWSIKCQKILKTIEHKLFCLYFLTNSTNLKKKAFQRLETKKIKLFYCKIN